MLKNSLLLGSNRLPLVRNLPSEVAKTDSTMRLSMPPRLAGCRKDIFNGVNDFIGSWFFNLSFYNSRTFMLEVVLLMYRLSQDEGERFTGFLRRKKETPRARSANVYEILVLCFYR